MDGGDGDDEARTEDASCVFNAVAIGQKPAEAARL
jgi:hypothetical protein